LVFPIFGASVVLIDARWYSLPICFWQTRVVRCETSTNGFGKPRAANVGVAPIAMLPQR
jgi:hypothetical protein